MVVISTSTWHLSWYFGLLGSKKMPEGRSFFNTWKAPRIGPKKKAKNSDFNRGINNTTTECRDGLRQLWPETTSRFEASYRLETEPGTRTSRSWPGSHPRKKIPNFYSEIHCVNCVLSFEHQNMVQKTDLEKTLAHHKGFICKRSFCSPSHWPHVISCQKVPHSFIFKAIAYLPASLSTPCGLQPISWLSWSQWPLCLPWRNRLEDRCQRGALECKVPKCKALH